MENSETKLVVLPTVKRELLARSTQEGHRSSQSDDIYESAWTMLWESGNQTYTQADLNEPQYAERERILRNGFTLRCFPLLGDASKIVGMRDAAILAEAAALHVDMVVTNNMHSIDHDEVNVCLSDLTGRNYDFVVDADSAMMSAHRGGEASRKMLTLFLAATWPDEGKREETISQCHERIERYKEPLAIGAKMPYVAQRLDNAFKVDTNLEAVINDARETAATSPVLKLDSERAAFLRCHLAKLR